MRSDVSPHVEVAVGRVYGHGEKAKRTAMDEPIDFEAFLHDRLAEIDGELAANKLEINLRPLRAAFSFVQQHILAVTEGTERHDIEEGYNYLAENWFALLYKDVETWFRNRYGAALDRSSKRTATGLVILWNTAFQLEVPLFRSKVETPGKTAWFSG